MECKVVVPAGQILREVSLRNPLPVWVTGMPPDQFIGRPRYSEHLRRIGDVLPPPLKDAFRLLRFNMLSALLVRGAFSPEDDGQTPTSFVDLSCDPMWWTAANATASLAGSQDVQLCSYLCENAGRLFVHLVPSASDAKSRSKLSGHTDASVLPLPGEIDSQPGLAPSPDLVILACIRNVGQVETRVAPLSVIHAALDDQCVRTLREPIFDFKPQASFAMEPTFVHSARPVLVSDANEGLQIRFSHSNVMSAREDGQAALAVLKEAISKSFRGVVLAPGDVLFVNNRTALHGRSEIGPVQGHVPRWLLRTYGMYSRSSDYAVDPAFPHALKPMAGGPPPI